MANSNKENLRKLLAFLNEEIIHKPENIWFVDELYGLIQNIRKPSASPDSNTISKIEKYLALDYQLDKTNLALDYSFVKDEYLRRCFEADCREMLRYRFGLRGHSENFAEFCRFGFMQIERIINAYYTLKGDTMAERVTYIKKFNERYVITKDDKGNDKVPNSVESINFSVKLWAFENEYSIDGNIKNTIDMMSHVRNNYSHGSANNIDEDFFQEHYGKLVRLGYPLNSKLLVDWIELKKDSAKYHVYNSTIKTTPEHKRYIELCWQKSLPYGDVLSAIKSMIGYARTFL